LTNWADEQQGRRFSLIDDAMRPEAGLEGR
jgi:hypothetical protein